MNPFAIIFVGFLAFSCAAPVSEPEPKEQDNAFSDTAGLRPVEIPVDFSECLVVSGYYDTHEPLTGGKPPHRMTIARGPRIVKIWPYVRSPASYSVKRRKGRNCLG